MLSEQQLELFSIYNDSILAEQYSKLLTTSIENLIYIDDSIASKNIFNEILKRTSKFGTMHFKKENKKYTCSMLTLNGQPVILDENSSLRKIIIRSTDLDDLR
jgi:hypothetical protein